MTPILLPEPILIADDELGAQPHCPTSRAQAFNPKSGIKTMSTTLKIVASSVGLGSVLMLAGCGQKGELYLPEGQSSTTLLDKVREAVTNSSAEANDADIIGETELQQIINDPNDY